MTTLRACLLALALSVLAAGMPGSQATAGEPERVAFVTNLYQTALGRTPAPADLDAWVAFLRADCGSARAATVVTSFIGSHEFRSARALPPADLPSVLYRSILDREPEPAAAAALLGQWRDLRGVLAVDNFLHSGEGQQQNAGVPGIVPAILNFVRLVYQQFLGREPEAGATTTWQTFISATRDLDVFVRTVVTSPEFEARPITLENYIEELYRAILHRSPFPEERDAWTTAYARATLENVTATLVSSQEFVNRVGRVCR